MPWTKLDDRFWSHPKLVAAGNEAIGIFARCLSYSGAHLTDGRIPEGIAVFIAGSRHKVDAIVAAGILERLPSGDLYIQDYADYNPLRAEIEARREARAKAGRIGGSRQRVNGT